MTNIAGGRMTGVRTRQRRWCCGAPSLVLLLVIGCIQHPSESEVPILFEEPVNYHVGLNPTSVTSVDLNGDGLLDLLTTNSNSHNVSVLLGQPQGTFTEHAMYDTGTRPRSLAVRDFDGDGTLGYLPMTQATEHAIAKAKEVGLGMGLVRHIGHYGSAGHYSRMCMEAGCIGFSVQGYQDLGNAEGSDPKPQLGYFGNPPICFAIPSGDEPPVVLDAATCIMADYQRGPEFDELLSIIPAAFFKSIGYTAVASLLGGALTGFTEPPSEDTALVT